MSADHQPVVAGIPFPQNQLKVFPGERDAAFRRRIVRPARDVNENGTACTGDDRVAVMARHDDKIVKPVIAPQRFAACIMGQCDRPVVIRMTRIVAPSVGSTDPRDVEACSDYIAAIRPVQHPHETEIANRADAVAFGLVTGDTAAPDGTAIRPAAESGAPGFSIC